MTLTLTGLIYFQWLASFFYSVIYPFLGSACGYFRKEIRGMYYSLTYALSRIVEVIIISSVALIIEYVLGSSRQSLEGMVFLYMLVNVLFIVALGKVNQNINKKQEFLKSFTALVESIRKHGFKTREEYLNYCKEHQEELNKKKIQINALGASVGEEFDPSFDSQLEFYVSPKGKEYQLTKEGQQSEGLVGIRSSLFEEVDVYPYEQPKDWWQYDDD